MPFVFDKWEDAEKFTTYADKTLADIVQEKCEPGVTWQDLALFNYGTNRNEEVIRCLIEQAGVKQLMDAAELTVLDPAKAPAGAQDGVKEIRIPKIWKKAGLPLEKTHTITVKQRKPSPSVSFEKFSRWFIPDTEKCDISYALQGVKERVEKVHLDVWASGYCKATETPIGPENEFYQYSLAACDVPVFQDPSLPADERSNHDYNTWDGITTATEGVLKKRHYPKRTITVANSPYTAQLRYFKNDADKTARIELKPFWPLWKRTAATTTYVQDTTTLKVEWEVKNCAKLKHGQLTIWDKTDKPVFRKALGASDLTGGAHDFTWTEGTTENILLRDKQPYRVQIQAHSDWLTDDGLALAVMHTEVRLWVHPTVGANDDRLTEKQCFKFTVPEYMPDDDLAKRTGSADEVTRWYKLKLAQGGFHPGVIDNRANNDHFQLALKEFQRVTAKDFGANEKPRYTRVKADGQQNEDTRHMLDNLKKDHRPLFGESNRTDLPATGVEAKLNDKDAKIIVWVDDRHYHTDDSGKAPNVNMRLENYGGTFGANDATKADLEKKSVARPFLPVEVALPLLSKADHLDFEGADPTAPDVTDAMRRAAGQLRVDWSFRDMEADDTFFSTTYNSDGKIYNRSKKFVEKIIKATPVVKHDSIDCYNCKETYGGIRPDAIADYYKKPFSLDADSLLPWRAVDDTAEKKICTLTHDDLGVDNPHLHKKVQGKTGVYLHPSRIAGDGYRYRAQVSFKPHPTGAWLHPNFEHLIKRYAALPQAHTCEIRLWRKASYRMFSIWADPSFTLDYPAAVAQSAEYYKPAFTHFVHESGQPESIPFTELLDPANADDKKIYQDLIEAGLAGLGNRAHYPPKTDMVLSEKQFWPWVHKDNLGLPWQKNPKVSMDAFNTWMLNDVKQQTTDRFYEHLLLRLLDQAEQKKGLMAGHFTVLYSGVKEIWGRKAKCNGTPAHTMILPQVDGTGTTGMNGACPHTGCTGTLVNDQGTTKCWFSGLGEAAAGLALGSLWIYHEPLEAAFRTLAHEYGHHKHLQHVGWGPHDSVANPGGDGGHWAQRCMMSYFQNSNNTNNIGGYDKNRYFCGKCILKLRGWKVEALPNVAGTVHD